MRLRSIQLRPARRPAQPLLALILAAMLSGSAALAIDPEAAARERTLRRDLEPGSARTIELHVPHGELFVRGGQGPTVHVEVTASCARDDCGDRLSRIGLEQSGQGDRMRIDLSGVPGHGGRGIAIRTEVRLPSHLALDVDMHGGEVRIAEVQSDLRVHLGAGRVQVQMLEREVGSIHLDATVGSARLELPQRDLQGTRSRLVGAKLEWNEGRGRARVDVGVVAGEVRVRLD